MQLDDFVGRFRIVWVFGGGGDDTTRLDCPWCDWQYQLPDDQLLAKVLHDLEEHMVTTHRRAA